MGILVVDDSKETLSLMGKILKNAGYGDIALAASVHEAFNCLNFYETGMNASEFELILMDIFMPDINGIEACRLIKDTERFQDIPIIIVSGMGDLSKLQSAFEAGAVDYITKPVNKVELLARIRSALKLKNEIGRRKAREKELIDLTEKLEEMNRELQRLSSLDGLTGIANRRSCDEFLEKEWRRAVRDAKPFSVIMIDIDFFKPFNDTYGHLAGDECLKAVAKTLHDLVKRPGDIICRYGGEEFIVLLPGTGLDGTVVVAEAMRAAIAALRVNNEASSVCDYITISLGAASGIPEMHKSAKDLIIAADRALYKAKKEGRNRTCIASSHEPNCSETKNGAL